MKCGDKVVKIGPRHKVMAGQIIEILDRPNQLGLHWVNVEWIDKTVSAEPIETLDHVKTCEVVP